MDTYNKTEVNRQTANLVDSSPTTLNTLNELALALGNDKNFSTTIAASIGRKHPLLTNYTGSLPIFDNTTSWDDIKNHPGLVSRDRYSGALATSGAGWLHNP